MTREEAIENLKGLLESNYVDSFEDAENEALDMAIKVIDMWNKLFKSYETIIAEITESGDTKNATKRIDDWCVEQLRGIISDYYVEMIMEDDRE